MKRSITIVSFLLWTGIIISIYHVVQKPGLFSAFTGLADTLWTVLVAALLLFNAYAIGTSVLSWLGLNAIHAIERLLLGCGLGLGMLGLLGLAFSAAQLANEILLSAFQIGIAIFFFFKNYAAELKEDIKALIANWNLSFSQYGAYTKVAIVLPILSSFLLTLVPPFEAFDALLYHLAQPARILQDGGLKAIDIAPFWFPSLSENVYLWAVAMGSERATQMIHFAWGMLAVLMLWHWAVKVWNSDVERKTLLLIASIPSLPMLASWAYADMALVFYATAVLYALTCYESTRSSSWISIAGVMAGLAMGVKYTSFIVPLTGGLLILFWRRRQFPQAINHAAQFSTFTLVVAIPWYVRNTMMMGNPFYPFVFGGRYWDSFLSAWYAEAGTGIGWNLLQLFLLPFNVMMGHHDVTFFDGRIGPLFLILAPSALWILVSGWNHDSDRGLSLQTIGLFATLSFSAWTIGVINSSALWQARLLLPALIPFAILAALGWDSLTRLDAPKLRISFLANVVIALSLALTVFDNAVFVLQRNPLTVAFGAQSREQYIARINPSYAALRQMMNALPVDAYVYNLFEPRSYGLPRHTQPDAINYNFAHDLYLYETARAIIEHWKAEGYTHILVYERGLNFMVESPSSKFTLGMQAALADTLSRLNLLIQTPDKVYTIYRIP